MTIPAQAITHNPRSTVDWLIDLSGWLQADAIDGTPTVTTLQGDAIVFSVAANAAPLHVLDDACGVRRLSARSGILFWVTGGTVDTTARISFATRAGRQEDVTLNIKLFA